jgi:DNA-binding Lrp family transcriptional regulator
VTEQARRIRRRLRGIGPVIPIKWLSEDLGIPQPSIRRSLSELAVDGFAIVSETTLTVRGDR